MQVVEASPITLVERTCSDGAPISILKFHSPKSPSCFAALWERVVAFVRWLLPFLFSPSHVQSI